MLTNSAGNGTSLAHTSRAGRPEEPEPPAPTEAIMKAKFALLALALAAAAPAYAGQTVIEQLSQETGISERKIQMIVGNRTPFAEYTYTYERYKAKFIRALGKERAATLLAGGTITLRNGNDVNLAMLGEDQRAKHTP